MDQKGRRQGLRGGVRGGHQQVGEGPGGKKGARMTDPGSKKGGSSWPVPADQFWLAKRQCNQHLQPAHV